jgi:SAM-dependent methyltransferase
MAPRPEDHVLDVGSGLGGASRYVASAIGCRVTGIDLTPEYVAAAQELARRSGLAGRVSYVVASALAMPFEARTFDAALTMHIAMNIRDRSGLYREIARVLKPGAPFCLFDVMRGEAGEVAFPVPWAETPATSHLTTPQEMQALLRDGGFEVREIEDRTAFALDALREGARAAAAGAPPPGPAIVMGASAPAKLRNVRASLESGAIVPVLMVARRAA